MSENSRSSTLDPHSDQGVREGEVDNINKRTRGGTSVENLCQRLERGGHHALLEGVRSRRISAYAAAVDAGIVKRRKTSVVDGNHNLTRRREHAMSEVLGRATYVCGELPCFSCRHLNATAALREIANVYLEAKKGAPSRASLSGVLPASCCQRQKKPVVEAPIA
jgi:hypothetical protein